MTNKAKAKAVKCDKCKQDTNYAIAVTVTADYPSAGEYKHTETFQLQLCNDCLDQFYKVARIPDSKQEQEGREHLRKKLRLGSKTV